MAEKIKLTKETAEKMKKRNDEFKKTKNPDLYLKNRSLSVKELK